MPTKTGKKKFEVMSFEELTTTKADLLDQRKKLMEAMAPLRAAPHMDGTQATQFKNLQNKRHNLDWMIEKITKLLKNHAGASGNKPAKVHVHESDAERFMRTAKELLSPETFDHVLEMSR